MRLLIAAVIWCVSLSAGAQRDSVSLFAYGMPDSMREFQISVERAKKQVRWDPAQAPPPLSVAEATRIGGDWMGASNPDTKQFEVTSVAVTRIFWPDAFADRWYYRIDFDPIVSGQRLRGGQFTAVVLFDGSVVEPVMSKRTFGK